MTLNRDGDRTKLGGDWDARGVRRVLLNPIYCGTLINHKYEIEDFLTGKQILLPQEQRFFHRRPEWAIVSPEVFQRAQEIMESRRIQYDSGEPFRAGRHSSKHIFSTLIKCAHCGRSFTRKRYSYVNTRVYWRCVTNDQYTAEKCGNRVILDEPELLDQLRGYFASMIGDREAFCSRVLNEVDKRCPDTADPKQSQKDLEVERKKLIEKRSRYQELYANDLITMEELKEKLSAITGKIRLLDEKLTRIDRSEQTRDGTELRMRRYRQEITKFLKLETMTNMDLRRILDHISVNQNGTVRVVLKKWDGAV